MVDYPDNWKEEEKYQFDWSKLKEEETKFQKINYNNIWEICSTITYIPLWFWCLGKINIKKLVKLTENNSLFFHNGNAILIIISFYINKKHYK